MKGFWAIIVRELRDKRTLLIGALALGVVPWIAPFFPVFPASRRRTSVEPS